MLKTENFQTYGWESAIHGMRNPMNSWQKSDTQYCTTYYNDGKLGCRYCDYRHYNAECSKACCGVMLGSNDLDLMKRLRRGGPDDRKYLRQIFVSVDITAPLYWWKEMDQYKVGTVTNSCSTMHKIASKEFTLDDFSIEHLYEDVIKVPFNSIIDCLNFFRGLYLQHHDKDDWWQLIQLLPSSYNQKRTWTANYEVLCNIYHARKNHKLDEWHTFCNTIENLPYAKQLIIEGDINAENALKERRKEDGDA